jgi:ribonucleoside-diphosphate reductase alpha chain
MRKIERIIKRDGRIVEFNPKKIVVAIWKALRATGRDDRKLAEELGARVVEKLEERFRDQTPHVEEIQDVVEETLVENGLYEVAKAYILYRRKRSEIREIKKLLGVTDDLKLTPNAVEVLRARYLLRDEEGNIIETPGQMLMRVARYIGLVDALYWTEVYDRKGDQPTRAAELDYDDYEPKRANLSRYEFEMLRKLYSRLGAEGRMRLSFMDLINLIEERWDQLYEETIEVFHQTMMNRYFLPNSPTLMNAGAPLGQLSACFVIPIEDSIESIFDALKATATIHKSGGGTGFDFSRLRPRGDIVKTTSGVASGPVSFMRIFDTATEVIKQGGKRRGANMGILRVDHVDIEEFIKAKRDGGFRNFNISIAVSDTFMKAVRANMEYPLINPRSGEVIKKVKARHIFNLIVTNAWETGDPGLLFIDTVNRHNPTPHLGRIEATNPCGEVPLLPYESCNLGSINLSLMLRRGEKGYEVDWRRLREVISIATHFLDNVIDANLYPLPEIEEATLRTRKIGLGVMGWAEMLFRLRIPYDSEKALKLAREIMEYINYHSKLASAELARKRGSFPAYGGSIYDSQEPRMPFEAEGEERGYSLDWGRVRSLIRESGIRNATTTSIAPTGTISIIAGTSSGIEPAFALAYMRVVLGGVRMLEISPALEEALAERELPRDEALREVLKRGILGEAEVPEDLKRVFITSLEIDADWHVRMQAAFQEFTDNAVSKTVNLRQEASIDEVERVFLMAYELGCKGITVYRYGSKGEQVLYLGVPRPTHPCPVCEVD